MHRPLVHSFLRAARAGLRRVPLWSALGLSACAATPNLPAAERTIAAAERDWAEALATGDTAVIERIIADDFIGVDPDGKLYDRRAAIEEVRNAPNEYRSNHLDLVKVRFYGNTAVAQGEETWERQTGEPRHGRFVWTDTWVLRQGRWQVVAAEDLTVLAPAP